MHRYYYYSFCHLTRIHKPILQDPPRSKSISPDALITQKKKRKRNSNRFPTIRYQRLLVDRLSAEHGGRDGLRQLQPDRKGEGIVRQRFQVPLLRDRPADGRVSDRPVLVVRMPNGGRDRTLVPVALSVAKSDPSVPGRRRRPVPVLYEKIRTSRLVSAIS